MYGVGIKIASFRKVEKEYINTHKGGFHEKLFSSCSGYSITVGVFW